MSNNGFKRLIYLYKPLLVLSFTTNDVPQPMRGVPVALITAGILAMAFMGFAGIKF